MSIESNDSERRVQVGKGTSGGCIASSVGYHLVVLQYVILLNLNLWNSQHSHVNAMSEYSIVTGMTDVSKYKVQHKARPPGVIDHVLHQLAKLINKTSATTTTTKHCDYMPWGSTLQSFNLRMQGSFDVKLNCKLTCTTRASLFLLVSWILRGICHACHNGIFAQCIMWESLAVSFLAKFTAKQLNW